MFSHAESLENGNIARTHRTYGRINSIIFIIIMMMMVVVVVVVVMMVMMMMMMMMMMRKLITKTIMVIRINDSDNMGNKV